MRPLTSNEKLALAMVVFCLLAVAVSWPRRAPEWNGRTLEEWLQVSQGAHESLTKNHGGGQELATALRQSAEAEDAFHMMGSSVVPRLIAILEGQDSPVRAKLEHWSKSAGWMAHPFGREAPPKRAALDALAAIGAHAVPALPVLSNALFQPEPDYAVVGPLVSIGPPALPVLMAGLTSSQPRVQAVAYSGLAGMGTNASSIEAALRGLRSHPDVAVRGRAITLLAATAPPHENPLPALLAASNDPDPEVRRWTRNGMFMAARTRPADTPGMSEAAAAVAELANDGILRDSRRVAAWGLQHFKTAAAPHVPALLGLLKDEDEHIRHCAVVSLATLKLRLPEAIPALADMLADPKQHIREEAAAGLREMAADVEKLQPGLISSLGDLGKARYEQKRLWQEDYERREAKRLERLKAKPDAKR